MLASLAAAGALCSPASAGQPSCTPDAPLAESAPAILGGGLPVEAGRSARLILRVEADASVPFTVTGPDGVAARGHTLPQSEDEASGDRPHLIETAPLPEGGPYRVEACGAQSRPFTVASQPYGTLAEDALRYFYLNRAGEPLLAEYTAGARWARAVGHPSEVVTCFSRRDRTRSRWPGCAHSLDVTGGWYDAGDYGKYAVNGGIAAWTLQNAAENGDGGWAGGRLPLPETEAHPDVPAPLLEARGEVELLMAMQVPQGARMKLAKGLQDVSSGTRFRFTEIDAGGLVHHKVHEAAWLPLPILPEDATETRYAYPPTTAGTLNMVAVAAQCARLWRPHDAAFADRCLAAARAGYEAALRHPDVYAYDVFEGGGPYTDSDLSDEFGWAATELYATTGEVGYLGGLRDTPGLRWLQRNAEGALGDVYWGGVDLLPAMTMMAARDGFSEDDRPRAATLLVAVADRYIEDRAAQGYRVPFPADGYGWGSNGAMAARGMVLGYAYEATGEARYREAAADVLAYLTGRNPLDQSYVAGHGARAVEVVHHRFWAHGADPSFPIAPPGALSGGPNPNADDGPVAGALAGCAPMRCWREDVSGYAVNEVAINWNAPLFWLADFLDRTSHVITDGAGE